MTERMKKSLLICGIASSLLYIAMNIFIPFLYDGYSSVSLTVSELSAIGTPTRTLWVWIGNIYTLLFIAFAWGILRSGIQNKYLRITGYFLLAYGIVSAFWPFFPMHQRIALAAGEKSISDTMHIALASVTVTLMIMSMGFGAAAFGKSFRLYTTVTILTLLVFGILTAMDAPDVERNLPTPYAGLWERINIGVFLLWIIVLARVVLKKEKAT